MKRTTKKLSGKPLELFLRRFFKAQPGIDDATARELTRAGRHAFASARVHGSALARWRQDPPPAETAAQKPRDTSAPQPEIDAAAKAPAPPPSKASAKPATAAANPGDGNGETAPFDPYSIGLVPTFQREGADGLMKKLAAIPSPDHLRKMARAQQVALPADLRRPEAEPDAIRSAIVAAVAKRIADRRAAAG